MPSLSTPAAHPYHSPVWLAHYPDASAMNPLLREQYQLALRQKQATLSHHFKGRYENTWISPEALPALQDFQDWISQQASSICELPSSRLTHAFWFNEMLPGQVTSRHDHAESDELLSAVYYIKTTADSGNIILYDKNIRTEVTPADGLCILFAPHISHEVEINNSDETRLSLAFNFGLAENSNINQSDKPALP